MNVVSDRRLLDLALRNDLILFICRTFQTVVSGSPYLHNWHIEAMCYKLQQCLNGEVKRLLITMPPRHLKSIAVSVAFVAWLLGHDPSRRIICASYGEDLASKHSRDCRRVLESDWYKRVFPRTRINPKKNTEMNFETTALGGRYSTSVGGALGKLCTG